MTVEEAKEILDNIWDFAMAEDDDKGDVLEMAVHVANSALEEVQALKAENTELHCELQAQNTLFSERDAVIEEEAVLRFVNWVDSHYNTEIHLERSDEYKNIHDFYEEFMDEMQKEKEEERD